MDLRVIKGALVGLPDRHTTLFLAKTTIEGVPCFGAVFGPSATCLPQNDLVEACLTDAMVAVFDEKGYLTSIHSVRGGDKYAMGGGIVYLEGSGEAILWTGADECGRYAFLGERIPVANVLVTT